MQIDATNYPIIRMDDASSQDMSVDTVLASLSELLARGNALVLWGDGELGEENGSVDDRRKVAMWMKANRDEIQRLIKGHVHVVADAEKRSAADAMSAVFIKFWGYPMFVVESVDDAFRKANALLANEAA